MKELNESENFCFRCGAVLMLLGAALHLLLPLISLCIYGVGALLFCLMQLRAEYEGHDITLKRLRSQQLLGCVCFILALALMSMQDYQWGPCRRNEWVVALTIGCVLELYTALRIPQEMKKDDKH